MLRSIPLSCTPSFVGEGGPDKADFWIFEIEKKFKVMRCPEEEKVNLTAYMLQGRDECWCLAGGW